MQQAENYWTDGYAKVEGLVPPEICAAFLERLKADLGPRPVNLSGVTQYPNLLARPAFEFTVITTLRWPSSYGD